MWKCLISIHGEVTEWGLRFCPGLLYHRGVFLVRLRAFRVLSLEGEALIKRERMGGREGAEETRTREEGVDERKGLTRSRVGMRMMETERLSPPFGRDILLSPVTLASDRPESSLGFAAGQLCDCEPVTFPL